MKPVQLSWIAAAMLGLSTMANAGFDGASSDDTVRQVGVSEVYVPFFHQKGKAGIGKAGGKRVDFESLANRASGIFGTTRDGIHTSGNYHFSNTHYNFAQAANQDVWFGEWYEGSQDSGFNNRVVYYVGDNTGTTVPTTGTATYSVAGVNKFNGSNKLSGTFTANFGTQKLTGSINNASLTVGVNANINASTAAFNGTATATTGGASTNGTSQGHFFGANASALAGIATFTNSDLDTAFGGSKN
ncbi:transferrin-binding protein-like solute binding protein [Vibrio sp. SCSIO 43132]|uniref:Slam-dependent surface lipoprotein n=1 Tax=Vibrio sp. SCSIO 43132 TaxID=2779363 RepID=UPI001CA90A5A|nr:Slam-dependent surface lipoprotein [Vibrio sp. SCSIO 43132]UAB70352.1 transferrin-binding protein-like solute binding protein [Vibrio sp. SCSIO 43132]